MAAEIINIIILICYEVLILFSCIRLTYFVTKRYQKKIAIPELVLIWTSLNLVLNFTIPSIFSFIQFNGIIQYLVTAVLIFSVLHINKKSELKIYKENILKIFNNIFVKIVEWKVLVIVILLLPFTLFSLRPVSDTDSLSVLNFLLEWYFNQNNPYFRAWEYVPVWELAYLPSLVISNSDNFFWLTSFKPMIILGLGTYLIGRELKLPTNFVWISVLGTLVFFNFWFSGSNMGTLKNDFIFASGIILTVYSLIRSLRTNNDNLTYLLFILGLIFLTLKFSGFFLGLISILAFLLINRNRIIENKKKTVIWAAILFVVVFLLTGHYYLFNLIEFGNPFYPVKVGLLGFEFPGHDLSSTSILANLDQDQVKEVFFPTSHISRGGIFFPLIMMFGFVGSLGVIFFGLFGFFRRKKIEASLLIISLSIFITWNLFLITPYSAGQIGSLDFWVESELNSTRYVIGTIFLTELLFVFVLFKLKAPQYIIFSFFGINIISRYWILLTGLPKWFDYSLLIFPVISIIGLFLFGKYYKSFQHKILILAGISILVLLFSPSIVEANRVGWVPWWHDVVFYLHELPQSEIFVIKDPERINDIWDRTYPVYGKNFQHKVETGTLDNLIEKRFESEYGTPEYVVMLCRTNMNCENILNKFEGDLKQYNYDMVAIDKDAILLKYVG